MLDAPSNAPLAAIRHWVQVQLGIRFDDEQAIVLQRRLEAFCRSENVTLETTWERLRRGDPSVAIRIAESVSTNHTFFYRERESFEILAKTIVPTLPADAPLRLWSAASSSGEEALSIAICMNRELGPLEAARRVKVLGTDISARQIRIAETGIYDRPSLSELPADLRHHLTPLDATRMAIDPAILAMCTFRRMNLAQRPWPFEQRFHVIFLRNVLYYFDVELRQRVVSDCFDAAERGAWLVTGMTEPMLEVVSKWTLVKPGLYRKIVTTP